MERGRYGGIGAAVGRYSLTEDEVSLAVEAEKKIKEISPKKYWDEDILRIQNEGRRYLLEQKKELIEHGEKEI
mgnify:CR=1 FL=1